MAERHPEWAEMIRCDLENESMNLRAAAKMLKETAKKKQTSGFYGMDDTEAEKLLVDFYKLPEIAPTTEAEGFVDLLALL